MGKDLSRIQVILDAIQQLAPRQRRRLVRQMRLAGLLDPDEELTDQNRLVIAPALSPRRIIALRARKAAPPTGQRSPMKSRHADQPPSLGDEEVYRSAVRGRVVVGAPGEETQPPPSVMPPLPGQAPEQPIRVIFDGGSRGNPGQGYGSYALDWPGYPRQIVQLQFGDQVTNNEAEYDTLIAALEAVLKRLQDNKADPSTARLEIWGDSQLVINQITGKWACKVPNLEVRRDRVRALLARFGDVQLRQHPRERSVEALGH